MACPCNGQVLAYRIASSRHPIFDSTGARLFGSRWFSRNSSVIHAASSYSGALLEVLVHANSDKLPAGFQWVRIEIPRDLIHWPAKLPHGWEADDAHDDHTPARQFGNDWYRSQRSAVLAVPSVPTRGIEWNLLINTQHRHFSQIAYTRPEPVAWDLRVLRLKTAGSA
ncbi:MAG: RES family NAD+ phosphorylase [Bryobacteraceae bacterium]